MPPKKDDDTQQGIMESIATLATAIQQQQTQINNIMGIFGSGKIPEGEVDEGEPMLGEGSEENLPPKTNPYQYGKEEAKSKLVDLCFDTPNDKLPELTETPRMQVTPTAYVEAMNIFIGNMWNNAKYEPFDAIFIRCRDKRMKSVERKSLMEAMAFSQIQEEKPEIGEGQQMGF